MKLIVFLALAFAVVACVAQAQSVTEVALDSELHSRQKRAICSNSTCNAHCILRGKRIGYCNERALCICR